MYSVIFQKHPVEIKHFAFGIFMFNFFFVSQKTLRTCSCKFLKWNVPIVETTEAARDRQAIIASTVDNVGSFTAME